MIHRIQSVHIQSEPRERRDKSSASKVHSRVPTSQHLSSSPFDNSDSYFHFPCLFSFSSFSLSHPTSSFPSPKRYLLSPSSSSRNHWIHPRDLLLPSNQEPDLFHLHWSHHSIDWSIHQIFGYDSCKWKFLSYSGLEKKRGSWIGHWWDL